MVGEKKIKYNKIKFNEFEIFWQCPNCKHPNKSITNDIMLNLSKFKCKECHKIYILRKAVTQVLCEPVSVCI